MTPKEGFAVAAVGLGQYVMEGNLTYRFSPSYPALEIISQKDLYNSQVRFCHYGKERPQPSGGRTPALKCWISALRKITGH
jgi:hypothetical protein